MNVVCRRIIYIFIFFTNKNSIACIYMFNKICIWHCFLVDKVSDRYASPSARPVAATAFIDQKAVPYMHFIVLPPTCLKLIIKIMRRYNVNNSQPA